MPIVLVSFALAPYAALLGILSVLLSLRVIAVRRRERIALGHADHAELERRVRAHANFHEYVPLALLLIWLAGMTGTAPVVINLLGLMLLLGRVFHAYALLIDEPRRQRYRFRPVGMVLTFTTLLIASALILVNWLGFALR